jgi:hypothetical protein
MTILQRSAVPGCYERLQTITALKLESGQPQIFAEEFNPVTIADGAVLLR